MKPIAPILFAFALFCSPPLLAREKGMDAALVRLNEPVHFGSLSVTPIAVLKDQRCIQDFGSCPIVSIAVVRLLVEQDGKSGWLDIPLGELQRWNGQAIAIAGIKPQRRDNLPIPIAAYRISIRRIPTDVQIFE